MYNFHARYHRSRHGMHFPIQFNHFILFYILYIYSSYCTFIKLVWFICSIIMLNQYLSFRKVCQVPIIYYCFLWYSLKPLIFTPSYYALQMQYKGFFFYLRQNIKINIFRYICLYIMISVIIIFYDIYL